MSLAAPLSTPFYLGGSGTTGEVPALYQAALDGVGFMLDETVEWGQAFLPLLRQQADTSAQPSEQSLSPEGLWRRSQESWHRGAGQNVFDGPESDPYRFRSSKGVDVWTRWRLSLLPDTDSARTSANTNLKLIPAGDYLYLSDGTGLVHTQDLSTWTSADIHAGEASVTVEDVASDGFYVYAALGFNGLHRTERGATVSSHYSDLFAEKVGYVKGRLMAAVDNEIFNVTSSGPAPAALFTHPNTDFTWVGFAPGKNHIYAAGYSGDKSLIYRTEVKADGTALDIPVVAGELPDGEIVRAIDGYLGYILVGTDKGVRFGTSDSAGNLTFGSLVGPEQSVRCFEGQGRYVWFGWDNYDSTSTGLGRLDLGRFTDPDLLVPAYASDLMVTGSGEVLSVVTFGGKRVLAVSGAGVYQESDNLVESGSLDSGSITYGLSADDKVALYVDIRHLALAGEVKLSLSTDGGSFVLLGSSTAAGSTTPTSMFIANESKGTTFELRPTLSRSSTDTTAGPTLTRQMLLSYPAPLTGSVYILPLLLSDKVKCVDEQERRRDPEADLAWLEQLKLDSRVVSFQLGGRRMSALVEDVEWRPSHPTKDRRWWNGTAVCRLKRFSQN